MPDTPMKIELIMVPVSDVDRAKAFYTEKIGFHADFDQQVSDTLRLGSRHFLPPFSPLRILQGNFL